MKNALSFTMRICLGAIGVFGVFGVTGCNSGLFSVVHLDQATSYPRECGRSTDIDQLTIPVPSGRQNICMEGIIYSDSEFTVFFPSLDTPQNEIVNWDVGMDVTVFFSHGQSLKYNNSRAWFVGDINYDMECWRPRNEGIQCVPISRPIIVERGRLILPNSSYY